MPCELIATIMSVSVLRTLQNETSVRWRKGSRPLEGRPWAHAYLVFDLTDPCLTHIRVTHAPMNTQVVESDKFIQAVAALCPLSCDHRENNA